MPFDTFDFHRTLAEAGRLAQGDVAAALAAFDTLGLASGERLAAVATVIASVAAKRHRRAVGTFLDELRHLTRPGLGTVAGGTAIATARRERVAEGVALLDRVFDRLAAQLAEAGIRPAPAGAVEAVLLARLLTHHRPRAVQLALAAAEQALARPDYRPGDPFDAAPARGDAAAS